MGATERFRILRGGRLSLHYTHVCAEQSAGRCGDAGARPAREASPGDRWRLRKTERRNVSSFQHGRRNRRDRLTPADLSGGLSLVQTSDDGTASSGTSEAVAGALTNDVSVITSSFCVTRTTS